MTSWARVGLLWAWLGGLLTTVCCSSGEGHVFVWGYGILGKGPRLVETALPERIPPTLFGLTEFNPDVQVSLIRCGLSHFAALSSKWPARWPEQGRGARPPAPVSLHTGRCLGADRERLVGSCWLWLSGLVSPSSWGWVLVPLLGGEATVPVNFSRGRQLVVQEGCTLGRVQGKQQRGPSAECAGAATPRQAKTLVPPGPQMAEAGLQVPRWFLDGELPLPQSAGGRDQ